MRLLSRGCFAAVFFLVLAFAPTQLPAQCPGLCGDLNSTGTITTADLIKLFSYLTSADSASLPMACANVDDHAGITLRDLLYLEWFIFPGSVDLDCDVGQGPVVPLANANQRLRYNSVWPAGDSVVALFVDVVCDLYVHAIALTLKVTVEGATPDFGAVAADPSAETVWAALDFNGTGTGNIPAGHLMGAFVAYFGAIPPANHRLGRAQMLLPPADHARIISLEQVELPVGSNSSMVNEGSHTGAPAWALNLDPWIVDLTGDVNNDRVITSSDIIGLVNYTFKSGAVPYPFAATGDVDCSGFVSAADIVRLVSFVFKSGAAPCDVSTNCTLSIDSWTCP